MLPIPTRYMKYVTLFLLISVFLYGIRHGFPLRQAVITSSVSVNELPIYSVNTENPVVALTFDSAWGDEDLADILSILEKHHAPATFFVTGEWAKKYPDAIIQIDAAGHEVANHGNSHKHMPQISKEEMAAEIQGCHNAVYDLIGKDMTLFRAPYSDWNDEVVNVAHAMGYSAINQSVDSLDWKDYGIDSIIHTVCKHKNLENGSIILLHNGATYTRDALDVMLTRLEEQGYSFVKVSSLIYTSDYYLDHTGKQFARNKKTSE
ncbi:MAG: polysaccharide deacetylase family protein [Bacteroidales bacterium]|nr:polysaccharide deacetylase family protein [Clostridium sp.]MCM1204553.1 polysaccharide deacetylase family protein [Bacteroidales bacterium]